MNEEQRKISIIFIYIFILLFNAILSFVFMVLLNLLIQLVLDSFRVGFFWVFGFVILLNTILYLCFEK